MKETIMRNLCKPIKAVCFACFFLSVFLFPFGIKARGEEIPACLLAFDYENYYIPGGKAYAFSETDVKRAEVLGNGGNETVVIFRMEGGDGKPSKGSLAHNGDAVNPGGSFSIVFFGSFSSYDMSLEDEDGNNYGHAEGKRYVVPGLPDGDYKFICTATSSPVVINGESINYVFRAECRFEIETVPPGITGGSPSAYGTCIKSGREKIKAFDLGAGINGIYIKKPGDDRFGRTEGDTAFVNASDGDGLYNCYATDRAGNMSEHRFVYVDTVPPSGVIKGADGNIIGGTVTGSSFYYEARDGGCGIYNAEYKGPGDSEWKPYPEGRMITFEDAEGEYLFAAIDKAGNRSAETGMRLDTGGPCGRFLDKDGNEAEGYVNRPFRFEAADLGSGINRCRYKAPGGTYSDYDGGFIENGEANGLYLFLAEDGIGNVSPEFGICFDTEKPSGMFLNDEGEEINTATGSPFTYFAEDNSSGVLRTEYKTPYGGVWDDYDGGKVFPSAGLGTYAFRAWDNAGNVSDETEICLDTVKPVMKVLGGEEEVPPDGTTNADSIVIKPEDSLSGVEKTCVKMPGETVYEYVYEPMASFSAEGVYDCFCFDRAGNRSALYGVTLDKSAPVLHCGETAFDRSYGLGFTVTAADNGGEVFLHVKRPGAASYETLDNPVFTVRTENDGGRYYFYATDVAGNGSGEHWIELCAEYPDPVLIRSETDNSAYVTWTKGVRAELDGREYTKGETIAAAGEHCVRVYNGYGLMRDVTFSINHNYVTEVHPPTCKTDGYTLHVCSFCGDSYQTDIVPALGHTYVEETLEPTCTEGGGIKHTCSRCGYSYMTDVTMPLGHDYETGILTEPTCTDNGERVHRCRRCGTEYVTVIPAMGHRYEILETQTENGITTRTYSCTVCGDTYTEDLGEQYDRVAEYVLCLFREYSPYMIWIFTATAGIWSIAMGVMYIVARRNEDREKAGRMIANYIIGLIVIFCIIVICPYLVRAIAILVT